MTVGELFTSLAHPKKDWATECIKWPPDVFALCSSALHQSGAYRLAVTRWPPNQDRFESHHEWGAFVQELGKEWRKAASGNGTPPQIQAWWKEVIDAADVQVHALCEEGLQKVCEAMLQLCAAADEASEGIGLNREAEDSFDVMVRRLLNRQLLETGRVSTLCDNIDSRQVCVLPKVHTPRTGITIRSMAHHLALSQVGEVCPELVVAPHTIEIEDVAHLLLIPWPKVVSSSHFVASPGLKAPLGNLPPEFGFFEYRIRGDDPWPGEEFKATLNAARAVAPRIDGVILPELALRADEIKEVWQQLKAILPNCFLISGVGETRPDNALGSNQAVCTLPLDRQGNREYSIVQDKHHRWLLDAPQIRQYGLSRQLDVRQKWWENTLITERSIRFVRLSPWLVLSFLICEDLARQDPISDLIRAVGPNLVIALLLDGPQLAGRWPSRYATVLADDPGCSVLTLTSIGSARLSRSLGKPESRVVALWKDAANGPYEIDLPFDADALILTLRLHYETEWTADGRCAPESAGRWELESVHPVQSK